MTEVKKAVKQFKKLLHRQPLCFVAVADILKERDVELKFYNKNNVYDILYEISAPERAGRASEVMYMLFRKTERYGFIAAINNDITPYEQLHAVINIAGRLFLRSAYKTEYQQKMYKVNIDMQAEAFAYEVLTSCKRKY